MNVVVLDRKQLLKDLNMVTGTLSNNRVLPILNNVLMSVSDNGTYAVTGTDMSQQISINSIGKHFDDFEVHTISAKKLIDVLKGLPSQDEIKIAFDDEKHTITAGRSRFTLAALPATDYPAIASNGSKKLEFSLPSSALRDALKLCGHAIAINDARYYLNGMLFDLSRDFTSLNSKGLRDDTQRLRLVATDGHRMSVADIILDSKLDVATSFVVPNKAVFELIKNLPDNDVPVHVTLFAGFVEFKWGNIEFITKLIDGKFPEYQRVIPKNLDKSALVSKDELKAVLTRALIMSHEKYKGIKLCFETNTLTLDTQGEDNCSANETIGADYEGQEQGIAFNIKYVFDVLNAIDCGKVVIEFTDSISSALFRNPDDINSLHVIMPMRL